MNEQQFARMKYLEGVLSSSQSWQIKQRCQTVEQYLQALEVANAESKAAIAQYQHYLTQRRHQRQR